MGCVKKRENSDRNFYFFSLCSANFTMIVFFSLGIAPQSISSQYYGKSAFFLCGSLRPNGLNTFQRKIPQQNLVVYPWKSTGAIDVAENNHE